MFCRIKKYVRQHGGFTFNRIWLVLDEYVYHCNHLDGKIRGDLDAHLTVLGQYGHLDINQTAEGEKPPGHSLHYEYLQEWIQFCVCSADVPEDCSCIAIEEEDGVEEDEVVVEEPTE